MKSDHPSPPPPPSHGEEDPFTTVHSRCPTISMAERLPSPYSELVIGFSRAVMRPLAIIYSNPLKLFRPARLKTLSVLKHRAAVKAGVPQVDGKRMSLREAIRHTYLQDGAQGLAG